MKKIFALSLFAVLTFSCCKDDDIDCCVMPTDGSLELNFTTQTQDGNMILFQDFDLENGMQLNINKLQFYISDIRLLKGNEEIKIGEVELVTFRTHSNPAVASLGESFGFYEIPPDTYTGVKFGIGVDAELNGNDPTYYAGLEGDHVLSSGIDYWSGWESYIFTKIEGFFDRNGNGTAGGGDPEEEITYHTGINELYREKTIEANIDITEGGVFILPLIVDMDKIFNSAASIDIPNEPVAHSNPLIEENMIITTKIADNLVEAIGK